MSDATEILRTSLAGVDAFIASLLLEDGLARNTLQAYRRDLRAYAALLAGQRKVLDAATGDDVRTWLQLRHEQGARATPATGA